MTTIQSDVAIVGGGPAGSCLGSLLRKYHPRLSVSIFERETFPREHVGESLLPIVSQVLDEMGCWDAVERANFPIKIGATYRWGTTPDLWDFEFLPCNEFRDEARPATYTGQRRATAFQVDRSVFDKILLDNARDRGCDVHEAAKVSSVHQVDGCIERLDLADGRNVVAKHYVDASGGTGILRRAMGIEVEEPTILKNIALWSYWDNAEWGVKIGVGGTRIVILSLGYGWIWFIPIGPTRTSVGFVCPAEYYKKSGKTTQELYESALAEEQTLLPSLMRNATRTSEVQSTRDWSFVAKNLAGANYFLVGEAAGFADPILSAGITLAMTGARDLAATIGELERGKHEADWLRTSYSETQRNRIYQHIQFADFWYSANGQFSDLRENTRAIALSAGLELDADSAFRWLGTGGFTNDAEALPGMAEFSVSLIKQIAGRLTDTPVAWSISGLNVFDLDLDGVETTYRPRYGKGKVERIATFRREGKVWPGEGLYGIVLDTLRKERRIDRIIPEIQKRADQAGTWTREELVQFSLEYLEVLLQEGWVKGSYNPKVPPLMLYTNPENDNVHTNHDMTRQVPTIATAS